MNSARDLQFVAGMLASGLSHALRNNTFKKAGRIGGQVGCNHRLMGAYGEALVQ
jgi:hypothetical protein